MVVFEGLIFIVSQQALHRTKIIHKAGFDDLHYFRVAIKKLFEANPSCFKEKGTFAHPLCYKSVGFKNCDILTFDALN